MISYQAHILEKLIEGGAREKPRPLAARLNELARMGEHLRKRYENECSYQWADTPEYEAGTRALESRITKLAWAGGLLLLFAGDCRGATVYVDVKPIPDNNYTHAHYLTIEDAKERRRRLAFTKGAVK